MKQYNILNERLGEYEDIDKLMSSSWSVFKNHLKNIFGINQYRDMPKETEMLKKVVKGPDIRVVAYASTQPNAYVIPGYYIGVEKDKKEVIDKIREKYLSLTNHSFIWNEFDFILASQVEAVAALKDYIINKHARTVTFKKCETPITIFVSYGLLSYMEPEERIGIYLHELGHWVDTARNIPRIMIKHLDHEAILFAKDMMMRRYSTRYEELFADNFAKQVGYGRETSSGMDKFAGDGRKNLALLLRYLNYVTRSSIEEQNRWEDNGQLDASTYPSIKTRKKYLEDEDDDDE